MQVGISLTRFQPSVSKAAMLPPGPQVMIASLANSTQLSLAEKREFARAILAAAGDPAKLKAILLAIHQLEAQRKPGSYAQNTVDEVMDGLSGAASDSQGIFA